MNSVLFIGDPGPLRSAVHVVVVVAVGVLYYASHCDVGPPRSSATPDVIRTRIIASCKPWLWRVLFSCWKICYLDCVTSCRLAQIDLRVGRFLRSCFVIPNLTEAALLVWGDVGCPFLDLKIASWRDWWEPGLVWVGLEMGCYQEVQGARVWGLGYFGSLFLGGLWAGLASRGLGEVR